MILGYEIANIYNSLLEDFSGYLMTGVLVFYCSLNIKIGLYDAICVTYIATTMQHT